MGRRGVFTVAILATLAGAYIGIMLAMFLLQRSLMYLPNTTPVDHPLLSGIKAISLKTPDGENIFAWYEQPRPGMPYVVYFHGNAGSLQDRAEKLASFAARGFGIMAVSYRGYGGSSGSPSEQGLYTDARTAIDYLKSQGVSLGDMVFYGESLGSGVATQMATEFQPRALALEAPYTSVARRSQEMYFFIPAYFLVRDKYDSISKITQIKCPLLIMHGSLDPTIPIEHGRRLFAAANEPKHFLLFPSVHHTDFPVDALTDALYKLAVGE